MSRLIHATKGRVAVNRVLGRFKKRGITPLAQHKTALSIVIICCYGIAFWAMPAHAETQLLLGLGSGYGADNVQVGTQWTQDWHRMGEGELAYGLAAEAAVWTSNSDPLVQLSVVPLLQYDFMTSADWQPFAFAGVGPAWISATQLGTRDLASEFQFSSRAGVGFTQDRHSWALEARHLSNGGIKQPNQGISYWNLTYGYRL